MQQIVLSQTRMRLFALIVAALCAYGASAATVSGTIKDPSGEPMIQAAVQLLAARDSSFVAGTSTDTSGRFRFESVKAGQYLVRASYVGYETLFAAVKVGSESRVRVPAITLKETSVMLKEAVVKAVKTEITVKEDTVEYNAGTYKTPPNAVAEDLFKRLPGVEVGSDGSITSNGQTVSKILVDGKEFFADDPKVASKNLPVDMIEKVQVVQRKSDLARLTGVDDGEDETVINLTVKKGMNNGWFGTVDGGYGTDDRYRSSFIVNRFWNGNQFTVIGNANNVNDAGFTDGNGGRFRRFGGDNGINTTQSIGINFNIGNEEIFRVGGDVMYSHNDRDNRTKNHRENLLTDITTIEDNNNASRDKGHNIRGDFRLLWNRDSSNTLEFRPNFSINVNDSENSGYSRNYNAAGADISNTRNLSGSDGTSYEFGGRLIYSHKFRSRPGRAFSIHADYRFSNVHEDEVSWSRNAFWQLDSVYEDFQTIGNHRWTNSINSRVSWTEPIGDVANGNFIQVAYRLQYRWNNSDKSVYNDPVSLSEIPADLLEQWSDWSQWSQWGYDQSMSDPDGLKFDRVNSSRLRNEYFNQTLRVGYRKVNKFYTLDAGMGFTPQMSKSRELINPLKSIPEFWVWNYAPYMRFRYKFSKRSSLNIDYNGRSSQPSISQMQPVEDSSDPMNVVQGNPDLKPTFTHNMRLRYQTFDMERQQSFMIMADASMAQNSVVSLVAYDTSTGGRYTTYGNVNGVWSARMFSMFSRPLRNKQFSISNFFNASYNRSVGFTTTNMDLSQNRLTVATATKNVSNSVRAGISPGLAFRTDAIELELRPRYDIQYTTNSVQRTNNRTVHSYGGMFNGTYYTPIGIVLNTDLHYSQTSGYASGYDTKQWMWNAGISYQFLRDKSATISIRGYDLLQMRKNIQRSITATMISDTEYNSLTRYFMATFTYKFSTFGAGERPQFRDGRGERRGPGGPGGPGRPPRP